MRRLRRATVVAARAVARHTPCASFTVSLTFSVPLTMCALFATNSPGIARAHRRQRVANSRASASERRGVRAKLGTRGPTAARSADASAPAPLGTSPRFRASLARTRDRRARRTSEDRPATRRRTRAVDERAHFDHRGKRNRSVGDVRDVVRRERASVSSEAQMIPWYSTPPPSARSAGSAPGRAAPRAARRGSRRAVETRAFRRPSRRRRRPARLDAFDPARRPHLDPTSREPSPRIGAACVRIRRTYPNDSRLAPPPRARRTCAR